MQLNYNHEFAEALRAGTKIHTIRRKEVQPGTKLTHVIYPYDRTRREVVLENTCTGCQHVTIGKHPDGNVTMSVDGRVLPPCVTAEILQNDGIYLMEIRSFNRYFGDWFAGYIIHWTGKRY